MHCPTCGQKQISNDVRFCSRCGFPLAGVAAVVAHGGELPAGQSGQVKKDSPRRRGIKKGVFIFLMTFLIVPLLAMFHVVTNTEPFLAVLGSILLTIGGLLRIVYAVMFESTDAATAPAIDQQSGGVGRVGQRAAPAELPASESIPAAVYASPGTGAWRDTNDLSAPGSVTDNTTKLLSKEKDGQ